MYTRKVFRQVIENSSDVEDGQMKPVDEIYCLAEDWNILQQFFPFSLSDVEWERIRWLQAPLKFVH